MVTNTDWWNGLPQAHKDIISAAARNAENAVRDEMSAIEGRAYAAAKENGMTIYTPSADEIAQWKVVSQPVYDAFLEKTGDAGKAMLDAAQNF